MNDRKVWVNGRLLPLNQAVLSLLSHVVSYATSVFEGIRVYLELDVGDRPTGRSSIWLLREHIARLRASAEQYCLPYPYSDEELIEAVRATVAANPGDTYIRPIICRGVDPEKLTGLGVDPKGVETLVIIGTVPWGKYVSSFLHNDGASALVTDVVRPRKHFPGHAKGAAGYAAYSVPAKLQANAAECSEGLLQGEDEYGQRFIVDGSGMNLAIVEQGQIITPNPKRWNILHGLTITFLTECVPWADVSPWLYADITLERLLAADEVFMTGTATEVTPVTLVKYRDITTGHLRQQIISGGQAGPMMKQWAELLHQATTGRRQEYEQYRTVVPQLAKQLV